MLIHCYYSHLCSSTDLLTLAYCLSKIIRRHHFVLRWIADLLARARRSLCRLLKCCKVFITLCLYLQELERLVLWSLRDHSNPFPAPFNLARQLSGKYSEGRPVCREVPGAGRNSIFTLPCGVPTGQVVEVENPNQHY